MDITWLGHGCFRLRGRTATVVTDPYSPALGLKLPKLEADLVTVSHGHENHAHVAGVGGNPFVVDAPGEYEVRGVSVFGAPTFHDAEEGARLGRNNVFVIEIDEVRCCHLGDIGHKPGDEVLEVIGSCDVLFVPVGGGTALAAAPAAEVVRLIEPRVVIPMHFAIPGLKAELATVDTFLKEMGVTDPTALPKLSIQSSAESTDATRVVLLEARS